MTEIEKLKESVTESDEYLALKVDNRLARAVKVLADFARIAVEAEGKWPEEIKHKVSDNQFDMRMKYALNGTILRCLAAHAAILAAERKKWEASLPDEDEIEDKLRAFADLPNKYFDFDGATMAIHAAMLKKQ